MINVGLPEATSYFWKQSRMATYDNWPFNKSDKCNAERMAAAGFYVVGDNSEPDLVECFICGKQLDGWELDDDPWSEHEKHQSNCLFVQLNKQNEKEWTVDELYNLFKKFKTKEYMDSVQKSITILKDETAHLMSELSVNRMSKNKRSTS
ncbi:PREDICTED: baculoviral IAP repeat-containing protein 5-like [Wasmannia auropunctata]|uniref:baculoviral IAP repeat-containing protein 5-like n=1 Tax=Wasmannia auropunctata TaxID=64793 RepID=UPI0005EF4F74|nr:PREDICTED: baculoviral IAP repeat-containing protein 5-like [Wasmannia auropunctata]